MTDWMMQLRVVEAVLAIYCYSFIGRDTNDNSNLFPSSYWSPRGMSTHAEADEQRMR